MTAEDDLAALLNGELDLLLRLDGDLLGDEAANLGGLVCRVALLERRDARYGLARELVHEAPVDEEALGGAADLAGVVHAAPHDLVHGKVHVAVGQQDEGVVAAQLEGGVGEVVGRVVCRLDARLGGAGEGDGVHVGVGAQPDAHLGAAPGHDLNGARRVMRMRCSWPASMPAGIVLP